eukprot:gene47879-58656_t
MSRTRTMDASLFQQLIGMAETMGLNPQQLPVQMTKQEGSFVFPDELSKVK